MSIARLPLAIAVTVGLLVSTAAPAQDRSGFERSDESVDVSRGMRFRLESLRGAVTVRGWDKDVVRVQGRHSPNDKVHVRRGRSAVSVTDEPERGQSGRVEYEIDVPRWMPLSIEVTFDSISVDGVEAEVVVETVRGQVSIKGGRGTVRAESIEGRVSVEGARARVEVSSVNDAIRLDGIIGDVSGETTNGGIVMTRMQSSTVEATTVNGGISYEGSIADEGHYTLSTHNGDIVVSIPARSNVSLDVTTYQGAFTSDLATKGSPPSRRGGQATYVLGSGSAMMDLESFGGSIKVRNSATTDRGSRRDRP
jgi:hypothetical protein